MHHSLELRLSPVVLKRISLHLYGVSHSSAFHLHKLLKQKSAVQSEIRRNLFHMHYADEQDASNLTSLSGEASGKGVWEQDFFICLFLFFFLFLSLSLSPFTWAASDHYLIGNNITVAVLGIVIPIGEYSWLSSYGVLPLLPACLLLPPRFSVSCLLLRFKVSCVWMSKWKHLEALYVCVCVCVHACESGRASQCL